MSSFPLIVPCTHNLSRFMQTFLTSFCVISNKKRRTSGHIFQGRFKAHLVESQLYKSRLSQYIHLNPVRVVRMKEMGEVEKPSKENRKISQ